MNITIIGSGGLGSNLATMLAKCGYSIVIYDFDVIDEKFMNRYLFHYEDELFWERMPKVELVKHCCRYSDMITRPVEFNSNLFERNSQSDDINLLASSELIIIATDRIDNRTSIEHLVKKYSDTPFVHIGCDNGSVSIYPTIENTIGEDRALGETSYNNEPDAETYFIACAEMIKWILKTHDGAEVDINIMEE